MIYKTRHYLSTVFFICLVIFIFYPSMTYPAKTKKFSTVDACLKWAVKQKKKDFTKCDKIYNVCLKECKIMVDPQYPDCPEECGRIYSGCASDADYYYEERDETCKKNHAARATIP